MKYHKGNIPAAITVLGTVIFMVAILSIFGPIAAGIGEQSKSVVTTTVGDSTSAAFNKTVEASGNMLSTAYQFGQLAVLGLLGGVAILGLLAVLPYFMAGGRGF